MSVLFINHTQDTFTPTQSGALATIIWECCRVAKRQGQEPAVITRSCAAAPFAWENTRFVDYPAIARNKLAVLLFRADRKVSGWRHLRQREFAGRIVKAIAAAGLDGLPMVLLNDPETAVVLRDAFPKSRIVHWFQNQHGCKPRYRGLFRRAVDAVAGCSDFISRWAEDYYALAAGTVRTIYNGVDSGAFSPAADEPDGPPVINFVGRTGIEKAPDLLLRAAVRLAEKTTRFSVQLIGSNHWDRFEMDDYQRTLATLADALKDRGIPVRRPGHIGRRELPGELRKAHIHVVPSRWDEPSALTLYEGMACGLATVASRTGGTPEIVNEHGFLFERDSVDGLANSLESLLLHPALRREYAARALARAREFTWDRVWSGLSELACG